MTAMQASGTQRLPPRRPVDVRVLPLIAFGLFIFGTFPKYDLKFYFLDAGQQQKHQQEEYRNSSTVASTTVEEAAAGSSKCHMLYSRHDDCPTQPLVDVASINPQCRPSYFIAGTRKVGSFAVRMLQQLLLIDERGRGAAFFLFQRHV